MSDYMFMLESHLSADQSRAVSEIQASATNANLNVFLTGGAMRDMLGGFFNARHRFHHRGQRD